MSEGAKMRNTEVISRREHELEVDRMARTIDRLNGELSALAAYLITAKPTHTRVEAKRATELAARLGRVSSHEAAESIQRIHDAVVLSSHVA